MKDSTYVALLFTLLLGAGGMLGIGTAAAQTGPGGVGNNDGSNGQPPNLLWLRGDAGVTTSSGSVTDWFDQSGNGNDITQGTATNQPTLTTGSINGVDVVTFDGSDDFLVDGDGTYLNGESGVTAMVVVEANATGSDAGILDTGPTADFGDNEDDVFSIRYDEEIFQVGTPNVFKFGLAAGNTTNQYQTEVTDDNVQTTDPQLITYRYENGDGNPLVLLDGSTVGTSTANTPSGTVSNMSQLALGEGSQGVTWDGDIAEVILFGEGLNQAERTVVHTYLAEKYNNWSGGGEVLSYDFTGNYFNDFSGIGQASDGTVRTDAQSAELQLTNPSTLSDGDFVLFGHDNSSFALTTSERPGGDPDAQKTEREWRVDLKGSTSQTVDVTVDLSSLSLPSGTNDYGIFVDADGDFTTGDPTFYPLDGTDTATAVALSDGDYVTVAAINRTVQFTGATASAFENAGGNNLGDVSAPALQVELNYRSASALSIPFDVNEVTSTLVEDETTVSGRNHPDYRRVSSGTFTISAGTTGPLNFNTAATIDGGTDPAFEVVNDARDAQSDGDESSSEDLDIELTGSFPSVVSAGATSTLTFTINDDDDPRKISFAGAGSKPIKILATNPNEDTDSNTNDLSDDENTVTTVSFEVALPEGIEGSASTFATFEVTGGETDDFSIPANGNNTKIDNRRGEVQVNNTQTVNGQNTGYGTFDLTIENDNVVEGNETLTVTLTKARSGTLDPDANANLDFNYTILNDDQSTVSFASSSAAGDEGTTPAQATLALSSAAETDLTVDFSVGGTAMGGGNDYTQETTSPATVPAGATTTDISFTIADDGAQEKSESIEVTIEDNATTEPSVGSPAAFTYTITDNDRLGSTGPAGVGSDASNLLWVRADAIDGVSDGNSLSAWADQSGNAHDLTAATAPTYNDGTSGNAINNLPVVTFSGGPYLEDDGNGAYLDNLDAVSVFSVVQSAATNTDAGYFDTEGFANGSDDLLALRYDDIGNTSGGDDIIKVGINNEAQQLETSEKIDGVKVQQTVPQIHQVRWTSGSNLTFALNGTDDTGADLNGSTVTDPLQANTVEIGRGPKGTGWDGQVAELFVFNSTLNVTQRTLVQNYLSAKYDVALTGTDVYAGDTGTNGDYDRGVFGVGQETTSDFHTAAETDGLRFEATAGGLSTGDYLLAGYAELNNAANRTDVNGLSSPDLDARMERDWYWDVTNSGSGPTVDVTFDLSKSGIESVLNPDASGYVLLFRSGQTGNWTSVSSSASVANGDEITFSGVDAGSQGTGYYTLGTTDPNASPLSGTALTVTGSSGNEGTAANGTLGGDAGWRMIGPPVSGATAADITSDVRDPFVFSNLTVGNQLFEWDDTQGSGPPGDWVVLSSGDAFESGRGHLLFLFDDDEAPLAPDLTLDMTAGSVPDASTDQSVSSLNKDAKFHVLANPFNRPFDLTSVQDPGNNSLGSGSTDFSTTVQIWDGGATTADGNAEAGSYVDVSVNTSADAGAGAMATAGDVVAPWQGFVVERMPTLGTGATELTFASGGTTDGTRTIVGSKAQNKAEPAYTKIGLKLTVSGEGTQVARDEAASVFFHPNATGGFDAFDASKLDPLAGTYAVIGPVGAVRGDSTAMKAVESRPADVEGEIEIPMQLRTTGDVSGTARVTAPDWTGVPDSWTVTLVDTKSTPDPADDESVTLSPSAASPAAAYTFALSETGAKTAASRSEEETEQARPATPPSVRVLPPTETTAADTSAKTPKSERATEGARFRLRIEPNSAALPVELAKMQVRAEGQQAVLSWTTASEQNNAGFYVEHQRLPAGDTTAAPTEEDWQRLTFVKGSGTTSEPHTYRHETGTLGFGRHTFRLRQVDTDGTETVTEPVETEVRLRAAYAVEAPYPNPARTQATLPVTVRERQPVTVEVYDVLGRRIQTVHDSELPAQNTTYITLPTQSLSSGAYFVRIRGEAFTATKRMTVIK